MGEGQTSEKGENVLQYCCKRGGLTSTSPHDWVLVLQVLYKHQGGTGASHINPPNPRTRTIAPIPDPVGPAKARHPAEVSLLFA